MVAAEIKFQSCSSLLSAELLAESPPPIHILLLSLLLLLLLLLGAIESALALLLGLMRRA